MQISNKARTHGRTFEASIYLRIIKDGVKLMKQVRLFGEEEPTILSKLELEKAEILAKELTDNIQNLCQKLEVARACFISN